MTPYIFYITLYDAAFFATIIIGLTFALLLWFTKKTSQPANRFLALALVVVTLWIGRILAIDIRLSTYFPDWDRLPLKFSLALGPLIFFYVLKITRPEYKFRFKDVLHFSPLLSELGTQLTLQQLDFVLLWLAFISVSAYLYWSNKLIGRFYRRLNFIGGDRHRYELRWLHNLMTAFGFLWLLWIPLTAANYFLFHNDAHAYYPLYILLAAMTIRMAAVAF